LGLAKGRAQLLWARPRDRLSSFRNDKGKHLPLLGLAKGKTHFSWAQPKEGPIWVQPRGKA